MRHLPQGYLSGASRKSLSSASVEVDGLLPCASWGHVCIRDNRGGKYHLRCLAHLPPASQEVDTLDLKFRRQREFLFINLHVCGIRIYKWRSEINPNCLPQWVSTLFLKQGFSRNLELACLVRLTGHQAPGIVLSPHPQCWNSKDVHAQLLIWVLGTYTQFFVLMEQVLYG